MDTSLVEEFEPDEERSSAESSEGFNFTSALDLRKNLTETFNKQVMMEATAGFKMSVSRAASNGSVTDKIAQFEKVTTDSTAASFKAPKPPLPVKHQQPQNMPPNAIPSNRLSVYLRIRPPFKPGNSTSSTGTSNKATSERSTIEVLPPKHPHLHSTSVRTYAPADSNASKAHSHNHRDSDASGCAKEYGFHQVLEPETTQRAVYATVAAPLVQSLFSGTPANDRKQSFKKSANTSESALLFSYGVTNAGKTHTILGNAKCNSDAKWGVIPRAISDIFDHMKTSTDSCQYDMYLSYFEIYNENIYDLIPKKSTNKSLFRDVPSQPLKLRERLGQTIVRGLAKHRVRDVHHGIELSLAANAKRRTYSNNLNADSSRSHCVCQLQLVPRSSHPVVNRSDDDSVISMGGYSTDEEAAIASKHKSKTLWIVDLAGSERSKRTRLGRERQKEASQINMSLMTLMRCLSVMRGSQRHSSSSSSNVVPFRESKLTHLFMSHLTGPSASRTSMIVNVNPSAADFDETQHVLAYASQVKTIQMNRDELTRKRKQFFGDEYDLDGRKKVKKITNARPQNATKKLATKIIKNLSPKKLAKKLSPKKVAKKFSPKKFKRTQHEKRKAAMVRTNSSNSISEPMNKRIRSARPTTSNKSDGFSEKELVALKSALSKAQAEVETLKSEKAGLIEELNNQEAKVRIEVAEEMEVQMKVTRDQYNEVIDRLRSQIHSQPTTARSTRKAQMDKAEQHIEELLDKVEECEEEMVRMRQAHAEEVSQLKTQLEAVKATKNISQGSSADYEKKIEQLESKVKDLLEDIEMLQRSKVELIENYEKLLAEEEDETSIADDESEEEQEEENSSKENERKQNPPIRRSARLRKSTESRQPLGSINGNIRESPAEKFGLNGKRQQWVFPKKPSSQDSKTGLYERPSGRAPVGREWDESVGAWRLHAL